ncbi:hypothetical protein SmJEL517_g03671 [Synchytrium microbalum]|uniref:EXS domain-containing protein n=1 Tax=Synchytrium microbalum TaxID=1806994 RepID=A0A507C5V2_9FUNG|nr:uncharacterized protein SmJEL517_g03671 [Synchytrium microbalum]TPX33454.1 hypothetical protein SmJEL517_g03671 [Synchytrium microbalum]
MTNTLNGKSPPPSSARPSASAAAASAITFIFTNGVPARFRMASRIALVVVTLIVIYAAYHSLGTAFSYIRELPLYFHVLLLINLGLWCGATNIHILSVFGIDAAVLLETGAGGPTQALDKISLAMSSSPPYTPLSPTASPNNLPFSDNNIDDGKAVSGPLLAQQTGWIPRDMYTLALIISCVTVLSLAAFGGAASRWGEPAAERVAAATYALILILTFLPFDTLYRNLRVKFLRSLRRIAFGTLYSEVPFCDVILADILTSYSRVFGDLQIVFWTLVMPDEEIVPAARAGHPGDKTGTAVTVVAPTSILGSWTDLVAPILISGPFLFRLRQCISEYNLASEPAAKNRHLANAGKYLSAIPVIMSSFMINWLRMSYRGAAFSSSGLSAEELLKAEWKLDFAVGIWVFFSIVNSLFSIYWDLIMDWSLFRRRHRHLPAFPRFLRPILHFKHPVAYYVAVVINVMLRLCWTIKVPLFFALVDATVKPSAPGVRPEEEQIPMLLGVDLALKVAEVLRRWLWVFFRIERELVSKGYSQMEDTP